ncbi:hypothetical protein LOD99_12200 [Oopsacas minuta]|uniref:Metallo-beta-lactamase domain-containing protein n=1 Tax=Oopsacas minuta TaxID=111878 RepID=A0AAV7JEG7_9METZ|nr:hypothetical protein LOD99_12200 [Oopsacas minuta]
MLSTLCIVVLACLQVFSASLVEEINRNTFLTQGQDWEIESGLILAPTTQENNVLITVLPLGDGDSTIIQCPDGDVILIDMGQEASSPGWTISMVQSYLRNVVHRITTVLVTHADESHYNFISTVLDHSISQNLDRIILSGYSRDYTDSDFNIWVNQRANIVEYVNYQMPCITDCVSQPPLCRNANGTIKFKYLGANLGNSRYGRGTVLLLQTVSQSVFFPGDSEGLDIESLMVEDWQRVGKNITATHMKLSRHGSKAYSNSEILIKAVAPQIAFSSNAYPTTPFFTPSCGVIDRLLSVGSITKRSHSMSYACGDEDVGKVKQYSNWPYEIYTTSPSQYQWQLLTFKLNI